MWEPGSAASRSSGERARLQLLGMSKRLRERVHLNRLFFRNLRSWRSRVSIAIGDGSRVRGNGQTRRSVRPAALRFSGAGKRCRASLEFGSAASLIRRLSIRRRCIFLRSGISGFRFRRMWSLSRLNRARRDREAEVGSRNLPQVSDFPFGKK
jgi:hypothetical protein